MAKVPIDLELSNLDISDITYEFCKTVSILSTVSTVGSSLSECVSGSEIYILDNPNVTEDSVFRVFVTIDSTKEAKGVFSPADGDIALESTSQGLSGDIQNVQLSIDSIDLELDGLATEATSLSISSDIQNVQNTLDNGTFGLAALKTLINAIDTSSELQARFDEIKGVGWVDETLVTIQALIDAIPGTTIGANSVTLTITDDSLVILPDTFVRITDSSQIQTLYSGYTDQLGIFTVGLDDGTYKVILRKSLYDFTVPETLVVSGTTVDSYQGTVFSPSAPGSPETCVVFGYAIDLNGNNVSGAVIEAKNEELSLFSGINKIVEYKTETTSNANGYWELELIKNVELNDSTKEYEIVITHDRKVYKKGVIIPDVSTVEFSTL